MPKRTMAYWMWAMVLTVPGAVAKETTPGAADAEETRGRSAVQLDKVVVTARRRDEALQDVPVSVTALDADELQTRGADDLGALGAATPNLTIYPARAFNATVTAYIRGVGQSEPVWGSEPGVAVYVDDVYLARPQGALLDILDVERIEVLRGPQGTLYGKNTIGGTIKYITRAVGDEFSGNVGITVGDYNRLDAKAVVNVPIGERLRTRVAFGSFDRDGFGKNLFTGEDVSARNAAVARLTAEWRPSDYVDVRLAYDRYRDRSGVRGARRLAINRLDPSQTPPDPGAHDVRSELPNLDHLDSQGASATVDWKVNGRWRLKSITAYREGNSQAYVDFDTLPRPITGLLRRFYDEQASQEFQLHWNGDRTHAVAGLYNFDGEAGGAGYTLNTFSLSSGAVKTRSAAIYGNLSHDFNDRLSTDLGLRYTSEKKTADVLNQRFTDATLTTQRSVSADFTDSKTFGAFSPRISLSYKPAPAAMLYASASRGFKSGTYNIRANTVAVPESALPLDDESATSYEIGAKTQWLQGRLALNAAVFRSDYRNIQLSVFTSYDSNGDGTKDAFFGDFRNAGAGTVRGAELELSAQTGKRLKWIGHAGYLDTRYDEYISGGVDISASQRFTNAPRWNGGASVIAGIPVRTGSLLARLDGKYQSKVYPTTDLSEAIAQDGYTLWNASLSWRSPQDRWRLALAGQNLSDKAYRTMGFNIPTSGVLTGFYGPPRTVSLSVTYYF